MSRPAFSLAYDRNGTLLWDCRKSLPRVLVLIQLLINPAVARAISGRTVADYSLNENTIKSLEKLKQAARL